MIGNIIYPELFDCDICASTPIHCTNYDKFYPCIQFSPHVILASIEVKAKYISNQRLLAIIEIRKRLESINQVDKVIEAISKMV